MPDPAYLPDMPELVRNARVVLWIQIALNSCAGVVQLPFFFPTEDLPESVTSW